MQDPEDEQQAPPEEEKEDDKSHSHAHGHAKLQTPKSSINKLASRKASQAASKAGAKAGQAAARIGTQVAARVVLNPYVLIAILIIIFFIFIINIIITMFTGYDIPEGAGGATSCTPSASQSATTGDVSHDAAAQQLSNAGISIDSSNHCFTNNEGCTYLGGIRQSTLDGVIKLKQKVGSSFTVFGGTEPGHSSEGQHTHPSGYKVDITSNGNTDAVSNYIKSLTPDGERPGAHGGPRYKDNDGNEYVFESGFNHWDITYFGNSTAPANPAGGQEPAQGGGGEFGGGGASGEFACPDIASQSATLDDCNAKYAARIAKNRYLKENFGDPQCDFAIPKLDQMLQQLDPERALKWHVVLNGESSLDPLAWADPGIGTPNPYGAWGLFQMGSRFKSNNSSDLGDVHWQSQISNGINYMKSYNNNDPYRYWCKWNKLFPGGDGLGHTASRPNCR